MVPLHATFFLFALVAPLQDAAPQRVDCRAWQECRQLAADAEARKDYEGFHDLAWRAVQTGPKNDPQLMYLLARAQSLSGRPGDALVMLQRLADLGMPNDAETNDDFRRVRALAGWASFRSKADAAADSSVPRSLSPAPAVAAPVTSKPDAADALRPEPAEAARVKPGAAPRVPGKGGADAAVSGVGAAATESLRFTTSQFTPAGLAYDGVSRRFIVGDRHARKLAVVDEFSQHVANLASAETSGFGEIAAIEIDPRQGNLWVVSVDGDRTALHKLQLVSGRSLAAYEAADTFGAARFADVAATADGGVLVLDAAGHRLFRLRPRGQSLQLAAALPDQEPSSVAPAGDAVVYVAHEGGLTRVELPSRAAALVKAADGVDLRGLARIRWHEGSLIAIQRIAGGTCRAVRIALNRAGRTATGVEVLDPSVSTTDPTAASVAGDVLYYLASGEGTEMIVKKVVLRKGPV
jgi:hypothetical protein